MNQEERERKKNGEPLDTASIIGHTRLFLAGEKIKLAFHKQTLLLTETNRRLERVR